MKEEKGYYQAKNVPVKVKKAISKYCKDKGFSHAYYLESDKRIKRLLKE